ncbi:hypothetical protein CRG98_021517 [Punica granatum]|uniref:Uncharacterized protein n=1 Tax=Punica granatum TaxID=22663 RepID=A0A2I0JQB5_PUNGR|nr:hypothetical protein CRG98_021517 [Punica granatum]
MAPADGSTAAKDLTVFKANILGGPGMATSSQSDVVKVAGNAELVTIVQLAAKKNTDNAINNSEELTSNIATGCLVEEDDAGAARNDLNKGKHKVSIQGDFPQVNNKPTGIGLVGDRDNETNFDDDLEVMKSWVKDSRQLRSTSMEVAKLVKRVQGISDHSPAMLRFGAKENPGPKPFKFFHFWTDHLEYMELVERVWSEKELDLRVELSEAIDKEEKLLKQKSRVVWLKAGDQNTAFFHRAVKERNARSSIRVLYSNSDAKLEGIHEIKAEAVTFFQELLGCKDDRVVGISTTQLSHILKRKVSHTHYQSLLSPITEEEIKAALFSMGNDKSPSLDGFTVYFFKHAWKVVHKDFVEGVHHFFSIGELRREVNSTIIALVPKKEKAARMKDFRPISCCNVVYKCITKVIANRLKLVLPDIISLNQTAFV